MGDIESILGAETNEAEMDAAREAIEGSDQARYERQCYLGAGSEKP